MKEEIRKDILYILRLTIDDIKKNNIASLRALSDRTLNNSTIYQDDYSISIAVIIYSLFKIYEKSGYNNKKDWKQFNKVILQNLENAYKNLSNNDITKYEDNIKNITKAISQTDSRFKMFITEIIMQSKVKKSSLIYEQGLPASRVSKLLGVSRWELMSYLGATKISDKQPLVTLSVKERLDIARKLFGLK